jgi:hypothetical protein
MKVRELIEVLSAANGDDEVLAFDADADDFVPVSGMVYGVGSEVVLQTDDDGYVELIAETKPLSPEAFSALAQHAEKKP